MLELRAVHIALRHFLPFLEGWHLLVRSDNTLTVYHVNHQGGTRSSHSLQETQCLLHHGSMVKQYIEVSASFRKSDALFVCHGGHRKGYALNGVPLNDI